MNIRPLSEAESQEFDASWNAIQKHFVDDPGSAVGEAERLVTNVLRSRNYDTTSFDRQVEDISVHHPGVVQSYRSAHAITLASERGHASTEDLRQAMVHYRAIFHELLQPDARSMVLQEVRS